MFIVVSLIKCSQKANAACYPQEVCNQWHLPISFNRCYYKRHYAAHQSHQISGNVAHKQNMRLHGSFSCRARFCVKLSPLHVYGSASKSLHVGGDMDGVTIAVPDPPQKKHSYTRTLCGNRNNQSPAPQ
jgi:hypothetical protein